MTTLETLNRWLADAPENEHLEFKEAKQQYDTTKLLRYCVALANEGGGHLVLGVSDKRPRQVVGTQAFQNRGEITARILEALRMRVDVQELQHPNGRVLVFAVPPRPAGTPLHHEGAYLMRAGEELVPMSPDHLKRIFAEFSQLFAEIFQCFCIPFYFTFADPDDLIVFIIIFGVRVRYVVQPLFRVFIHHLFP